MSEHWLVREERLEREKREREQRREDLLREREKRVEERRIEMAVRSGEARDPEYWRRVREITPPRRTREEIKDAIHRNIRRYFETEWARQWDTGYEPALPSLKTKKLPFNIYGEAKEEKQKRIENIY